MKNIQSLPRWARDTKSPTISPPLGERYKVTHNLSPPAGERYREGVFVIQLTKTEQLPPHRRFD